MWSLRGPVRTIEGNRSISRNLRCLMESNWDNFSQNWLNGDYDKKSNPCSDSPKGVTQTLTILSPTACFYNRQLLRSSLHVSSFRCLKSTSQTVPLTCKIVWRYEETLLVLGNIFWILEEGRSFQIEFTRVRYKQKCAT
jgi:hypothetical protein